MRPNRITDLRHETVDMFYHGFDNYMRVAFPEDEVSSIQARSNAVTPLLSFTLREDLAAEVYLQVECTWILAHYHPP